jgi:uncharacterized protein (DUF2237 family)
MSRFAQEFKEAADAGMTPDIIASAIAITVIRTKHCSLSNIPTL